jgi:A/G-specific adenine glycosylase
VAPDPRDLTRRLARWYARAKRDLPWRRTRDPYGIWLSEVMTQQTTVAVAGPRWERFLARFPDVNALARARERDVLAEWAGLGYYARARNLHRAARAIASAGTFPATREGWRALPGVGAYTAAAVASIACGAREAAVDGNVVRVLSRVHALALDAKAPATFERIRALASALVPARDPGEHNQALMDLGALVCTPKKPRCPACPLRTLCRGAALARPEAFPRKARRRPTEAIHLVAGLVRRRGALVLMKDERVVAGHLVPPMFPVPPGQRAEDVLRRGWKSLAGRAAGSPAFVATLRHSVLHRRYRISLFTFEENSPRPSARATPPREGKVPPVTLVQPARLARHAHGGLLLKALAAFRAHRAAPAGARRVGYSRGA